MNITTKPADVVIVRGELSCWVTRTTRRGRWLSQSLFDVPDEEYSVGYVTGARLALELVRLVREATPEQSSAIGYRAWQTLIEAAAAPRHGAKRGAVVGFLGTMSEIMLGGILHTTSDTYAAARLADAEKSRDWWTEEQAKMRDRFTRRMRAARAAKRERAAVAALTQWGGIKAPAAQ